jgi:hypothetical protein
VRAKGLAKHPTSSTRCLALLVTIYCCQPFIKLDSVTKLLPMQRGHVKDGAEMRAT